MKKVEQIQVSAIARFFSSAVIKELAVRGKSPMLARLIQESGLVGKLSDKDTIGLFFDHAFDYLKRRVNRHEYIYKAAITKKVLLGIHSLQTASMLTEFRVGQCKADVVILNGTGAVYEIKSERDSLSRLETQLASYMKVFATVNVIVGENHLDAVMKSVPDEVGILKLSGQYKISTIRNGIDNPARTCPISIFDAVNLKEAKCILKDLQVDFPAVPNTQQYGLLRDLFKELDPESTHRGMVKVLKNTRNLQPLKSLLDELPESLHSVSLSVRLRKRDHERLIYALRTPITEALCWR